MVSLYDMILERNPHLREYIREFEKATGIAPKFYEQLTHDLSRADKPNVLYPVGDPIFIHIFELEGQGRQYNAIEPSLTDEEDEKRKAILADILRLAPFEPVHTTRQEFEQTIDKLLKVTTIVGGGGEGGDAGSGEEGLGGFFQRIKSKAVSLTEEQFRRISYRIKRDIIENGILEPLIRDPYIEDIHSIGEKSIHIIHKVFGMLSTNLNFKDKDDLEYFLRGMSERIGKPVSDAHPIIDAALPDGSRINIIYSDDVSKQGSSFTIRKFAEKPPTMPQLIKWGTFSAEMAAYLWLCLEHGMSIFMSGETASGKTTSLNAMLTFVSFRKKIFTAEDTPEVIVPQPIWQRLITREAGPEDSRVVLFDLVKAALRSRPDYIIIGEIRGQEGAAAFQAMQTGHAVMATFHASSITKMIQRFTGDPINVPIRFMDNLNLACFQELVYSGGRILRRCSGIEEIIRYSKQKDGVLTRAVFTWDPVTDKHHFRGMYNSHILEGKIAPKLGMEDPRVIYVELKKRQAILQALVDNNVFAYDEVNGIFRDYSKLGYDGIPKKYLPK